MRLRLRRRNGGGAAPASAGSVAAAAPDFGVVESRLAWILGSQRTGSTWLLRLLIHPLDLARTPTALNGRLSPGDRAATRVIPINESMLPRHLTPMARVPARGVQPAPEEFIANNKWRDNPNYFFSDEYVEAWRPWIRAAVLARFRAQAERAAREHGIGDYLIVVKEPNGSHGAEFLMKLLPAARMIFLQRDGRDVIDSILALRSEGMLPGKTPDLSDKRGRKTYVRRASRLWVQRMDAVSNAYRAHDPDRRIRVRYEDLRADTFAELRRLNEWLGLERSDEEIRAAVAAQDFESLPDEQKGIEVGRRAAQPGLWRESLSEQEQRIAEEVMGEKLRELGYPA